MSLPPSCVPKEEFVCLRGIELHVPSQPPPSPTAHEYLNFPCLLSPSNAELWKAANGFWVTSEVQTCLLTVA